MANEPKASDFVEVYHTDSTMTAQRILDVILAPAKIEAILHQRQSEAFPSVGHPGGWFVAVPQEDQAHALGLLREALESGYLEDNEGDILDETKNEDAAAATDDEGDA